MILIGLTGGIGSGKSEVAKLLTELGAIVIDADLIVRNLQQPGQPGFVQIAATFGKEVIDLNGNLNRNKLAGLVFSDSGKLESLNKIMHPLVRSEMNSQVEEHRRTARTVVLDIPLLYENPRQDLDGILLVDLENEIATRRLVEQRKMKLEDVEARIYNQSSRSQRRSIADYIIDNSGSREELKLAVTGAWKWMSGLK